MPSSVGGLFLQVKLETAQAEAQLKKLTAAAGKAMSGSTGGATGVAAVYQKQTAAAKVMQAQMTSMHSAAIREDAARTASAQKSANAQISAQKRVVDQTKKTTSAFKTLGAGTQELFVGLGAARSGNIFYGLAAGARYAKNLTASLQTANKAATLLVAGLAGIAGIAGLAVAGVIGAAVKLSEFGVKAAASFETLTIQFTGLLQSEQRAREEMGFLLKLGQESIVPTQALMDADRQLLSFGVTVDSTRRNLVQFISDFGTATTASTNQIYFMGLALSQVAAQGKANSVDMKQLANAGINTAAIYEIIGKQIGMSAGDVREGVSSGLVTADRLFAALSVYGSRFADTAEAARKSTQGLMSNIVDIVTTQMGLAFKGVNENVGDFLQYVQDVISNINFSHIADSIMSALKNVQHALGMTMQDASDTSRYFSETLPNAIEETGAALAHLVQGTQIVFNVLYILGGLIAMGIEKIFDTIFVAVAAAGHLLETLKLDAFGLGADVANMADSVSAKIQAALAKGEGQIEAANARIEELLSRSITKHVYVQYVNPHTTDLAGNYVGTTGPFSSPSGGTAPVIPPVIPPVKPPSGSTGMSKAQRAALDAANAWLDKYRKLIGDAEAARKKFVEIIKQPFGEPSQLQEALTSQNVKTIIGMNDTLREQLIAFYKPLLTSALVGQEAATKARRARNAAMTQLDDDTRKLLKLAKRHAQIMDEALPALDEWRTRRESEINDMYDRLLDTANTALDIATTKYEEANAKLESLIAERDAFLNTVETSLRSFVNDLNAVETEIQTFTRLDAVGSFLIENKKQTADFEQGLQDRLTALRTWIANIRTLMARGLDSNLVQDFVSAGVEASGGVVAQLAGADSGTIANINSIQSQLTSEIDSFKKDASAAWFDAGIAQAQAYVTPLQNAVTAGKAQVALLEQQQKDALAALQKSYTEQKAALEAEMKVIETATLAVSDRVQAQFTALAKSSTATGVRVVDGLIQGLTSKDSQLAAATRRLAAIIRSTLSKALGIHSPSTVASYMGQMVGSGMAIGLDSSTGKVALASQRMSLAALPALRSTALPATRSFTGTGAMSLGGVGPVDRNVNVRVFIGDKELTDLVDLRIEASDADSLNYLTTGRRF
jgi:tape measure domain-containing protein